MAHVLFVCVRNAGRSQMSEALFRQAAAGRHGASSAGRIPPSVSTPRWWPWRELGIDLSRRTPQRLSDELVEAADVVFTMGCGDACPVLPRKRYVEWDLPDSEGRPEDEVRATRDDIAGTIAELVAELDR